MVHNILLSLAGSMGLLALPGDLGETVGEALQQCSLPGGVTFLSCRKVLQQLLLCPQWAALCASLSMLVSQLTEGTALQLAVMKLG